MLSTGNWLRSLLERHPWIPWALTAAYVGFTFLVVVLVVMIPDIGDVAPQFFSLISNILTIGPVVVAILQILNLRRAVTSIPRLALLYLEIILMFGVIYFCAVSEPSATKNGRILIKGIDTTWVSMVAENHPDKAATLKEAALCFQDCVYFSLVTSTTVGYGDIVPVSPMTRLLVGVQVLVSFFLIAFGAGYFFASQSSERGRVVIAELENRLSTIESKLESQQRGGGEDSDHSGAK